MFEELYAELIALPKYKVLQNYFPAGADHVHDGYFSQDKKGNYKNTKGDTLDDYNTYNTIMKDKEWLLSFDCPLRFVFSHSALKEGWDNPNVFQICTLIEQKSTLTARQKSVAACVFVWIRTENESKIEISIFFMLWQMKALQNLPILLQKEIENETGIKFGILGLELFNGMIFEETTTEEKSLTENQTAILLSHLADKGFIKAESSMSKDVPELPKELEAVKEKSC